MDSEKFLGICILVAAVILAGTIVWHAKATSQVGRYQFLIHEDSVVMWVIDTTTGEVTVRH